MSAIRYRPEVDGMRALAIVPVVLFHLGCGWIPGGFAGVDVFFVISGFLITGIILKEREQGVFSFWKFWERRIRRIFPALFAMLAATLLAGFLLLFVTELHRLASETNAVLTMRANFKMLRLTGDYWGPVAESIPLLHTWSLAVEEQFYLVYPLLLVGLLKFGRSRALTVLSILACVSFALCVWRTPTHPAQAFYHPHTRAWELLAGCVAALAMEGRVLKIGGRAAGVAVGIGLSMILASFFLLKGGEGFPGYKALLPVAGAVAVILFARDGVGIAGRALSARPVVYVGRLSYSLYLWHWPLIVFARAVGKTHRIGIPDWAVALVSVVLAVFSLEVIEPRGKKLRPLIPWSVGGLACLAGFAALAARHKPAYDIKVFAPVEWDGALYSSPAALARIPSGAQERMRDLVLPVRETPGDPSPSAPGMVRIHGEVSPSVCVLGDSHALMWAATLDETCRKLNASVCFQVAEGTPPFFGVGSTGVFSAAEKRLFDEARLRDLKRYKPKVVIVATRWASHIGEADALRDLLRKVRECSPGCTILLPQQPPVADIGDSNALHIAAWLRHRGGEFATLPRAEETARVSGIRMLAQVASDVPGCRVVDIGDIYQRDDGRMRFADGDRLLYIDDDHLSRFGASLAGDRWRHDIGFALGGALPSDIRKNTPEPSSP
jgi:peptidoglycan/LPS O-acetylase OafA/YrhL